MARWLASVALLSAAALLLVLPLAHSQDVDSFATDPSTSATPALPWYAESPNWVYGQEFSAVASAPYIGTTECLRCHDDLRAGFLRTAHVRSLADDELPFDRQGCEACHGAGGAHAALGSRGAIFAFDWADPACETRICLRCHEWLSTPQEWLKLAHAKAGLRCSTCHDPHVGPQWEQRYLLRTDQDELCAGCHTDVSHDIIRFSRHPVVIDPANEPAAPAMHCTDCHDVHAGKGPRMLRERRITDLCVRCHMDKGGPFRYTHMAMEEGIGQGCLVCHKQHGSDLPWLITAEGRALCTQCHSDREQHYPALTCYTTGCHVGLHGSNKSSLFLE